MKNNIIISPSLLSADFANLQDEIQMLNSSEADWIHIDVMDGNFVPNISFGFPVIAAVNHYSKKPLDVHLMIVDPDRYLESFKKVGASYLTVHYEACAHLHRTISKIKELGMFAGVAINPHTPVSVLEDIIQDLDMVLIMSVNPGFGGQKFIENTFSKIKTLREMSKSKGNENLIIQVDGGVNIHNAHELISSGANSLVAGNAIFATPDPIDEIKKFKTIK